MNRCVIVKGDVWERWMLQCVFRMDFRLNGELWGEWIAVWCLFGLRDLFIDICPFYVTPRNDYQSLSLGYKLSSAMSRLFISTGPLQTFTLNLVTSRDCGDPLNGRDRRPRRTVNVVCGGNGGRTVHKWRRGVMKVSRLNLEVVSLHRCLLRSSPNNFSVSLFDEVQRKLMTCLQTGSVWVWETLKQRGVLSEAAPSDHLSFV